MIEVSIIIPTFHDWQRLSKCLHALAGQSFPKEKFEVWVVNNDPKDAVPENFFVPSNCTILSEGKPGSYAARNAALKLAKGTILGFTDSDCIPDKDWIANAVHFLDNNKNYDRIAGRIQLFYKNSKLTLAELYEKVYAFKQDFAVSKGIGVTGNMFTYRHVFEKIGPFNDQLLSGGDNEWSLRAQKAGFKIAYVEDAFIYHPARYSMDELTRKAKRVAGNIGNNRGKAVKRLLKYSIPPINSLLHGKNLTLMDRLKVFGVRYYLNMLGSLEGMKVAFGKKAERR